MIFGQTIQKLQYEHIALHRIWLPNFYWRKVGYIKKLLVTFSSMVCRWFDSVHDGYHHRIVLSQEIRGIFCLVSMVQKILA